MNNISIDIAGYIIGFESEDFEISMGRRFEKFCLPESHPPAPEYPPAPPKGGCIPERDFQAPRMGGWGVKICRGTAKLPSAATCLFHAPYVEERNGIRSEINSEFWSIWQNEDDLFIKTTFPLSEENKKGLLKFSLTGNKWDLIIDSEKSTIDPMEYPLDGLILYYLTVINGDIMIHASGVSHEGKGYVFSGVSGKGKTTMARLWNDAGATVIHDDRLIIRKTGNGFRMHNTPVYDNEQPVTSEIDRIFLIEHGKENISGKLNGSAAIGSVITNCIQHNWGPGIISGLLASVTDICSGVPVYRLSFRPDKSIIDHING